MVITDVYYDMKLIILKIVSCSIVFINNIGNTCRRRDICICIYYGLIFNFWKYKTLRYIYLDFFFKLNPVFTAIYLLLDWFYDALTILATQQELKDIRNVFNECEG